MNAEMLALLRRAGLNSYEAKTYSTLLSTSAASAASIAELAGIPRPRAYDILEKLERKGFVSIQPGRPVRFKAIQPGEAFEALRADRRKSLESELAEISSIESQLKKYQYTGDQQPTSPEDNMLWVLRDRDKIHSKISSLIQNAQKSILIASSEDGLRRKLSVHEDTLRLAKRRGVDIRIVAPQLSKETTARAEKFGSITKGAKANRFVVVDDHAVLFLTPEEHGKKEVGAWIQSPYFAQGLRNMVL